MPRTTAPTAAINNTSLPPENLDLLTLASLEAHPAVQQAIAEKEPLAQRLDQIEEQLRKTRSQLALYSSKGQQDEATARELAQTARERLAKLEREHTDTIGLLRQANAAIAEVTEQTRLALLPELAHVALPEIDARLHGLALIDAVQRLVGRKTPLRSVRAHFTMERRYLSELRALLTAADPS